MKGYSHQCLNLKRNIMNFYLGQIALIAGSYAPQGWHYCDGAILEIGPNASLYSLLGTTYGGDGTTNFVLPNLEDKVVIGSGETPENDYKIGDNMGSSLKTMTINQMPMHFHWAHLYGSNNIANTGSVENSCLCVISAGKNKFEKQYVLRVNTKPTGLMNDKSVVVEPVGNGYPMDNRQPYLSLRYIIRIEGEYPPRD